MHVMNNYVKASPSQVLSRCAQCAKYIVRREGKKVNVESDVRCDGVRQKAGWGHADHFQSWPSATSVDLRAGLVRSIFLPDGETKLRLPSNGVARKKGKALQKKKGRDTTQASRWSGKCGRLFV